MERQDIIAIFHRRLKKIKHFYGTVVQEDFDVDAIHDFRVEIKKMRAFIRLVNTETFSDHQIKILAGVKEFYRATGEVRNLQLHQQRVVRFCSDRQLDVPGRYLDGLHTLKKKEQDRAERLTDKISFHHFEKEITHAAPRNLTDESIQYFVLQRQRSLQQLLQDSSDETLHEIRKILKDLLYTWGFISTYVSFFLPQYFTSSENIDMVTSDLGDFHDLCIAIGFFNGSLMERMTDEDEEQCCRLMKANLEENKARLKNEILLSLQRLTLMPSS